MIFDDTFGIHEKAMKLRAHRSEVLASNIVNAETPGYKARDFDFQSVLKNEMAVRQGLAVKTTNERHIATQAINSNNFNMQYRMPHQASLDGNTVEAEREQVEFSANSMSFQASMRFLDGKIKGLKTAIKGQGQ